MSKKGGFTTLGTLLFIASMSLPAIVSVVTFRANWSLLSTAAAVWCASAVSAVGVIYGNTLSKRKVAKT